MLCWRYCGFSLPQKIFSYLFFSVPWPITLFLLSLRPAWPLSLQFFAISEFPLKPPAPFPIFSAKKIFEFFKMEKNHCFHSRTFPFALPGSLSFFSYLVFLPFILKNSFSESSFICILRYTFHFIFHVHVSLSWRRLTFPSYSLGFVFFFLFILKFQLKWTTSISIISLHVPFYDSVEPNFAFTVQKFCILLFTTSLVFPIFLSFFFNITELILYLYGYLSCYMIIQLSE